MNSKNKKLLSKINSEKRHASITKIKRKRRRELALIILIFLIFISVVAFMYSPYMKIRNRGSRILTNYKRRNINCR